MNIVNKKCIIPVSSKANYRLVFFQFFDFFYDAYIFTCSTTSILSLATILSSMLILLLKTLIKICIYYEDLHMFIP